MATANLKRWASNALLIPAGLLVGALVLEIGLRVVGISYPVFYVVDEHTGLALKPGAHGWYRQEGKAYVRINSDGLRDTEHSKAKSADSLRIAVLGDSFAEALQVPMESAFWAIMEKELRGCSALSGRSAEVINFGVSGYGTAQELITLRHRVWAYDPDLVLLAFFAGNDISDNSRTLKQNPMLPYFIYESGELILDDSFIESDSYQARQTWYANLAYRVVNSSRVLQLVVEAKLMLEREGVQEGDFARDGLFEEPGLHKRAYIEPEDHDWAEAWRATEGLILLMRDEVMENDSDFLVVTLSSSIQVHPDPLVRNEAMATAGIDNLFYPDLRIKALGEHEGFPVLNLAQPLQAYAQEHQVFLHGFQNATLGEGHWNIEGHLLAGQLIAEAVCQLLLDDS